MLVTDKDGRTGEQIGRLTTDKNIACRLISSYELFTGALLDYRTRIV